MNRQSFRTGSLSYNVNTCDERSTFAILIIFFLNITNKKKNTETHKHALTVLRQVLFIIGAASSVISSATTVAASTATKSSSINQYWTIIVVFGTFGFMLFAGILIWLVGKIYATFYGYPRPEPVIIATCTEPAEHESSCDCRRCTEQREREEDRRLIRSYEARCEELCRLYREIGDEEGYRRTRQSFLQHRETFNLPEIPTNRPSCAHAFDDVRIDVTEAETNTQQSKFGFRRLFRSWLPSREERMGRREQLLRKAGKKRACEPLYEDQNDSQNITLPRKESPPVSTNMISWSFWMNIYYLMQLPFFGVTNLVYELWREPDVVRRYYMNLLPFSGDLCWEETQMASWEFSRQLFSALPFCDVSDEVLRECAGSSAPKMSSEERRRRRNAAMSVDDVEANASPSEEQFSALEQATDFVQYADETENKFTAPDEITRLD